MFQYPCLVPLILPERDLHMVFSSILFHPSSNIYFSPGEFFKPFQYQKDELACQLSCGNKFSEDLKNHVLN